MSSPGKRAVRCLLSAGAVLAGGTFAFGAQVKLGQGDGIAWSQPKTYPGGWVLTEPGTENIVGPVLDFGGAILDTGANGIIIFHDGYLDDQTFEHNPNLYPIATRPDGSKVQFVEIGVGGNPTFDTLALHDLVVFPNDDPNQGVLIPNVRALGAPDALAGTFVSGLLGMPVMHGRYVHLDMTYLATAEDLPRVETSFLPAKPAPGPRDYVVNLEMLPAEPEVGQVRPGDPLPTYADLPMIPGVRVEEGMRTASRTMLLDTGSQLTMITTAMAQELGLDLNQLRATTDIEGSIPVGGIGGQHEAPLLTVDRLVIPTDKGDLVLTDLTVGIIDVPGIGGIFGMNILTSGYVPGFFEEGVVGYFETALMDFASANKTLTLSLNPNFEVMTDSPRRLTARAPAGNTITWDAGSLSFDEAGAAVAFRNGDFVTFGAAAAGKTIQVVGDVAPTYMEFDVGGTTPTVLQGAAITGTGGISKRGTGTLRVENSNLFTGRSDVRQGLLHLVASQDIGDVFVHGTGSLRLSAPQQIARMAVHNGTVTVDPGRNNTLVVGDASVSGAGRIDLADNVMIVRLNGELFELTGLNITEIVGTLTQRIADGRNPVAGSTWDGFGITSSSARANTLGTTGLGIMLNSTTGDENGSPIYNQFMGQAVDQYSILIAYTYAGDLDLDGDVDGDDVMRLDRSFIEQDVEGYSAGDINYDGRINAADFFLMDRSMAMQGTPFNFQTSGLAFGPSAIPSPVPEPATILLAGIGAAALTMRRRR